MSKPICAILAIALAGSTAAAQTVKGLAAKQPYPGLADKMALFAQFVAIGKPTQSFITRTDRR
jgi:hypothetical protein